MVLSGALAGKVSDCVQVWKFPNNWNLIVRVAVEFVESDKWAWSFQAGSSQQEGLVLRLSGVLDPDEGILRGQALLSVDAMNAILPDGGEIEFNVPAKEALKDRRAQRHRR